MMHCIAYGFRPDLPALSMLEPEAIGNYLRVLGCAGVFMHHPEGIWVQRLHTADLQVFASLGIFSGQNIWQRFPASRPVTADGAPAPREEWYEPAIPTLPELRDHRLREFEEMVRSAPIDGVWLDFIRWPARWERAQPNLYHSSFDPITLRAFQADTGISIPAGSDRPAQAAEWILDNAAEAWFDWRCEQITSFVAQARALLRQHLPDALLGVFTVPWREGDFDGAFVHIVGQDPARLAPYVDVFSPMVYHRMCRRDVSWIGDVTRWVRDWSGQPVWPVVEAVESPETYPAAEFVAACREALGASGEAVVVFTLEGLLQDPARTDVWKSV